MRPTVDMPSTFFESVAEFSYQSWDDRDFGSSTASSTEILDDANHEENREHIEQGVMCNPHVAPRTFRRLLTPTITAGLFDAIFGTDAAWKNLLAIPGSTLFPQREPRRNQLASQLDRVRSLIRRK